jgi:glycosyltransferase involved in cell wall biosynthesis
MVSRRQVNVRRIAHAIPTLGLGGAERQLAYLSAECVRRGWSVHVIFREDGANGDRFRSSGATLHRLGGGGNSNPLLGIRYAAALREIAPSVVQTWLAHSDVFVGAVTRVCRIPWVLSERASAAAYPTTYKNALRVMLGRRADAIVANSRAGAEFWKARVPTDVPCVTIPNAVPVDEIAALARMSIERPRGGRRILFVGRLDAGKNPRVLLLALGSIRQSVDATLLLCGDGPLRSELEELTSEQHLEDEIQFLGTRSDVLDLMTTADVFVSPSLFEGHPNAVLEAAACGCPIIVSDIPAHREFLDDTMAVFVDPQSSDSIAAAVRRVLSDSAATQERVARARAQVLQLSAEKMADRYEYVYDRLIRGGPLSQDGLDRGT